jgi:hypothetical protein
MTDQITYRARVIFRGAVIITLSGKTLPALRARAIRQLTQREPGFACCWPLRVELFAASPRARRHGKVYGSAHWTLLEVVDFKDIPPSQYEYLKNLPRTA